jgi:hypothetical protein
MVAWAMWGSGKPAQLGFRPKEKMKMDFLFPNFEFEFETLNRNEFLLNLNYYTTKSIQENVVTCNATLFDLILVDFIKK